MTIWPKHRCFPLILLLVTLGGCDRADPVGPSTPKPLAPAAQSSTTSTTAPKPPEPPKQIVTRLTVALIDPASATDIARGAAAAISARLEACWKAPESPDAPPVSLQLNLNLDGSVQSVSVLEKKIFASNAAYRAAAREATSAFFKCSPFVLPISGYAGWKSLALRITPHH
jgi:hypothetical protein